MKTLFENCNLGFQLSEAVGRNQLPSFPVEKKNSNTRFLRKAKSRWKIISSFRIPNCWNFSYFGAVNGFKLVSPSRLAVITKQPPDLTERDWDAGEYVEWRSQLVSMSSKYRVVFLTGPPLKMTKCQITCKSLQKSSKCQNFLRVSHLVIFRADQSKRPPCM